MTTAEITAGDRLSVMRFKRCVLDGVFIRATLGGDGTGAEMVAVLVDDNVRGRFTTYLSPATWAKVRLVETEPQVAWVVQAR